MKNISPSLKTKIDNLKKLLQNYSNLEMAILVGSQTTENTHSESDWDIAIQWKRNTDVITELEKTETLREDIANLLNKPREKIDFIHIPDARLAMREVIANNGIVLKGRKELPWYHFLSRTWRELEEYDWKTRHVD
ncbi:MAG: nucleotidyltransferase domain-containing protein [Pseudomonadota bacterium]